MAHKAAKRWQIAQKAENERWQNRKSSRSEYLEKLEEYWGWYLALISKYISFNSEQRILDIGCGSDGIINYIPNGQRFGLDPLMDSYLASSDMPHDIKWNTGTMEAIPFDDKYFDVVVTTNALDHAFDPKKGLAEMRRVLKSGGYLVLTVACYAPIHRFIRLFKEKIGRGDQLHPYNYSQKQVRAIIKEAGFTLLANHKGNGTIGVWFYKRPPEGKTDVVNKAANMIFWL